VEAPKRNRVAQLDVVESGNEQGNQARSETSEEKCDINTIRRVFAGG